MNIILYAYAGASPLTPKNCGPVLMNSGDYIAACQSCMTDSHVVVTDDHETLIAQIKDLITATISPFLDDKSDCFTPLPRWLLEYMEEALLHHPNTKQPYSVPFAEAYAKVHKFADCSPSLEKMTWRLLTKNFCWITQPFGLILAKLIQPYEEQLPEYVKDSDAISRVLRDTVVPSGAFIITIDVVSLYPRIVHSLCYQILESHLNAHGCPYTDFALALCRLVLDNNYCQFNGDTLHQITGFATGVSLAKEVAQIYVHGVSYPTINAYDDLILIFKRFVDDYLLIFTGSKAQALQLISELQAIRLPDGTQFAITFEISDRHGVFLDIDMSKGRLWRLCGVLDTVTHVKPINPHLHVPPFSCAPRHQLRGMIRGEFIRNLKRCSSMQGYYSRLHCYREELSARGYPDNFLNNLFESAPLFERRDYFLSRSESAITADSSARPMVCALPYSHVLYACGIGQLIKSHAAILPSHLRRLRSLVAWRKATKFASVFRLPGSHHSTRNLSNRL
eukprot:SAG25_NODE_181_length_12544_cov_32.416472_5_plen_507_part_00